MDAARRAGKNVASNTTAISSTIAVSQGITLNMPTLNSRLEKMRPSASAARTRK